MCTFKPDRLCDALAADHSLVLPDRDLDLDIRMFRRRQVDGYGHVGALQVVGKLWAHEHILDPHRPGDVQVNAFPDAKLHHARAEVPPVAHAALVRADQASPADLWLFVGRWLDDDGDQVLLFRFSAVLELFAYVKHSRGVHPSVMTQQMAVEEELRLVIDA